MVSQLKDNSCLDFPSLWSWFAGWGTNIEHSGVFSGGPGSWAEVFFWWLARRVWCIFETPWQQPGYYWCAAREAHGTPDPPNNRIYHNATHSPTFTEKETLPSWNYWLGEFSSLTVLSCEADEHKALDWVPAKFFYSSVLTFSPKWYF